MRTAWNDHQDHRREEREESEQRHERDKSDYPPVVTRFAPVPLPLVPVYGLSASIGGWNDLAWYWTVADVHTGHAIGHGGPFLPWERGEAPALAAGREWAKDNGIELTD